MSCQRSHGDSVGTRELLCLLSDEYAMEILTTLTEERATATELTDRCSGSKVTIYRRLNRLEAAGLVQSRTRIRSDGNHCQVYWCPISDVAISLADGEFEATFETSRSPLADDRVS